MKQEQLDLIYLCGCMVNGIKPEKSRVQAMELDAVHTLAKQHTLSAITYYAVEDVIDRGTELAKAWQQERDMAIRKNLSLDFERSKLFAEFEKNGIRHMALKGALLKDIYPKAGMRQMADNDVIYDKAHQRRVYDIFLENGYYCKDFGHSHHDVYMKEPFYNFEMHTSMLDPINRQYPYYEDIWSMVGTADGKQYECEFSDEDFYIFLIVHGYMHFSKSGTGLRTLLDFYVYNRAKHKTLDYEYIGNECERLGLRSFEKMMRVLSWKVFSKPSAFNYETLPTNQLKILRRFFAAGVFGTVEQKIRNGMPEKISADKHIARHDKLKYLMVRIFPDMEFMKRWCRRYFKPAAKCPILLPVAYPYRLLYKGITQSQKAKKEIKTLNKM